MPVPVHEDTDMLKVILILGFCAGLVVLAWWTGLLLRRKGRGR